MDKIRRINQNIVVDKKLLIKLTKIILLLIFILWTIIGMYTNGIKPNPTLILFETLYLASILLLISLGLTMTYKLIGFANFAHAEYFVMGAYVGVWWSLFFNSRTPQFTDLYIVIILAFIVSGTLAVIGDLLIFGPLRKKGSSPEAMMISSIGWGIVIRNVISIFYGSGSIWFTVAKVEEIKLGFTTLDVPIKVPSKRFGSKSGTGFLNIADKDYMLRYELIFAIFVAIVMVSALFYFLEKTKTGKAMRATSDNIDLAESSGINTISMIRLTWFIGGGLAGVAGIIFAMINPLIPYKGFQFLLPAFAVVVLAGVGSLKGSVYASLIIAGAQRISVPYLSGLEDIIDRDKLISYAPVVPFIILIIVILFKPTGLYGEDIDE